MWIYSSTSNTFTNGVVHFRLALAPAASLDGCSPLARFSVSAGLDFHHKKAVFQAAARQSASLFATHHHHDPLSKLLKLKATGGRMLLLMSFIDPDLLRSSAMQPPQGTCTVLM